MALTKRTRAEASEDLIDSAAQAPEPPAEEGRAEVLEDEPEQAEMAPEVERATPAEDRFKVTTAAERRARQAAPEPGEQVSEQDAGLGAGQTALRFDGPMRTYNFHGLKFERGKARPVANKHVEGLLATGFFRRANASELDVQADAKREKTKLAKYPVGRFATKELAANYAEVIHKERLDMSRSLRQLNARTLELARRIDDDEVTPATS